MRPSSLAAMLAVVTSLLPLVGCEAPAEDDELWLTPVDPKADGDVAPRSFTLDSQRSTFTLKFACDEWFSCDALVWVTPSEATVAALARRHFAKTQTTTFDMAIADIDLYMNGDYETSSVVIAHAEKDSSAPGGVQVRVGFDDVEPIYGHDRDDEAVVEAVVRKRELPPYYGFTTGEFLAKATYW